MSMSELYEWEAFYQVEPWGTPAEDDRWRQAYALTFAVNASAGASQPDWLDRIPEETARRRAREEAAISVEDKVEAFFPKQEPVEPRAEDFDYIIRDGVIVAVPREE